MAKLKIVFRKEIWADLNTYYPNFTPGLRKQIDNAIYKLLGGQETPAPQRTKVHTKGVSNGVMFRYTKKEFTNKSSKSAALIAEMQRNNQGLEWLKDDILKCAVQHKLSDRTTVNDLVRGGYLELIE